MASEALEKEAKLQSRRLVIAEGHAQFVISEFEQRYAQFVYGHPWLQSQEEAEEYFRAQGESDDALQVKRGQDVTSFPLHGMHMNVMLPYMLSGDPMFLNEQREGADDFEMARVDLFDLLAGQIWKEGDTTFECQRALLDAFCYRMGWVRTEFDGRTGLPRHRWVDSRDMLLDCQTRSPRIEDKRWIAEKMVLPIETAEWFAKNIWDAKGHEFQRVQFDEAYAPEQPKKATRRGNSRRGGQEETDSAGDFVRIVMVQVKGENPYTQSAKYGQKKMNDPAGHDDVYDGKDHVLILEAVAGWQQADGYKAVGRIDWQFPCKRGEFTYTPFMLTKDNRGPYPYSIMQPGHSSQVAADLGIQAYNTDVAASARRWFAVNEDAFQDPAEARRVVEGINSGAALVGGALKQGYTAQTAIGTGNFGQPNPATKESHAINRENYEAVSGMQKFDVQVRANQTATNTAIQNESAQVKVDSLNQLVRRAVISVAEKGVMCARANMTYAQVKKWVNPPLYVGEEPAERESSVGGRVVLESSLWPNNPDWADIRNEVEVNLQPASIQFRNPEKQAQDITELMQRQLEVYRVIGDSVGKGAVTAAQEIARSWNETVRLLCRLKNIINYERLLINFDAITQPEPPPVDPNQMMQSMVEAQGNAANAQQQAAATRLQNMGVSPGAIPAEAGGMG